MFRRTWLRSGLVVVPVDMSLRYLASMNQTQVGASTTTSISEAPSSPPASKPSGGETLSHNLTAALRSVEHVTDGKASCHKLGNHASGNIWRSDRKTFQVTASSLLALFKCFSLLPRMSAKTGSYRSMIRFA